MEIKTLMKITLPPILGGIALLGASDILHASDPVGPSNLEVHTKNFDYSKTAQSPSLVIDGKVRVTLPEGVYEHVYGSYQIDQTTGQQYPYMFYRWGSQYQPAYPGAAVGQEVDGKDSFVLITPDNKESWYNIPTLLDNQWSYVEAVVNGKPIVRVNHRDGSKPEDEKFLIGNDGGEFIAIDLQGYSSPVGGFEDNVLIQQADTLNIVDLNSGKINHKVEKVYESALSPNKKNIIYVQGNKVLSLNTSDLTEKPKTMGDLGPYLKITDNLIVTEDGRVIVLCLTHADANYGENPDTKDTVKSGNNAVLAVIDTDGVTHILSTPKDFMNPQIHFGGAYYSLDETSISFGLQTETIKGERQLVNPINFSFDKDSKTGLMRGEVLMGSIHLDKLSGSFTFSNWDGRTFGVDVGVQPNANWRNDINQIISATDKVGDSVYIVVYPNPSGSEVRVGGVEGNGGPSQGYAPDVSLVQVAVKKK